MRRLLGPLLLLAALTAQSAERVLDFHGAIRIGTDGVLVVTETIAVQVEGREIKRGILRDFPTVYQDRLGNKVRVPFTVLEVKRNDKYDTYATERLDNGVRVRIGNPHSLLPHGKHVYEIQYQTARQIGFFEQHDELYWNVNGTGWTLAMDHVAADVTLPIAVPSNQMKLEAYTGFQGVRGRHYTATAREGGAAFHTSRTLVPREGLTIVVAFPKGIVAAPTAIDRARWFLSDNQGVAVGLAGLLAVLAFFFSRWWNVGRDPRAGPMFPRYEPPPGLGPAGARYLDRMSYDDRCFAVGLLGLGQRGGLKIREQVGTYDIERTGKPQVWLPGEQALADGLLGAARNVTIGGTHNPQVAAARDGFRAALVRHFGEKLFSRNWGSRAAGIALALAVVAAMVVWETPIFAAGAIVLAMVGAVIAFWRWMPAYSAEGRRLMDQIDGLRQYLGVAEKDDLARMKAPPQTKEEFAKLLPYAVALDVEKTWADRFTTLLGAAAVAAAVSDFYQSDWGGGSSDASSIGGLSASLSGLGDTIAAAATPPGSSSGFSDSGSGFSDSGSSSSSSSDSGGSSGGSSGGGGGGGGGSGW